MKIDWTQTFVDKNGRPIVKKTAEGAQEETINLKELCVTALDAFDQNEKITSSEKYERYTIIKAINEDADITIPQLATIQKAVDAHAFVPYVHGQICDYLNQKEVNLKVVKGEKK